MAISTYASQALARAPVPVTSSTTRWNRRASPSLLPEPSEERPPGLGTIGRCSACRYAFAAWENSPRNRFSSSIKYDTQSPPRLRFGLQYPFVCPPGLRARLGQAPVICMIVALRSRPALLDTAVHPAVLAQPSRYCRSPFLRPAKSTSPGMINHAAVNSPRPAAGATSPAITLPSPSPKVSHGAKSLPCECVTPAPVHSSPTTNPSRQKFGIFAACTNAIFPLFFFACRQPGGIVLLAIQVMPSAPLPLPFEQSFAHASQPLACAISPLNCGKKPSQKRTGASRIVSPFPRKFLVRAAP